MVFFPKRDKGFPQPQPVTPPPKECDHKWTDLSKDSEECWYLDFTIDDKVLRYDILEPFVCIHCKERKNVRLESLRRTFSSNKDAWKFIDELREKYPQIKDRPIVEDRVADIQLVDREYLKYAALVTGVKI